MKHIASPTELKTLNHKNLVKKNNVPRESWEQEMIFKWACNNQKKYPELKYMNGSLSGVRLTVGLRIKAKKQGNKKGVPDIDLPAKNKYYSGLHIELKRVKGGVASKEQKDFLQFLADQGRKAVICKGHEAALKVLIEYLENI
jgi:hypothetical protein